MTRTELPGDPADTQSRYIEAAVNGVLITSLYAPNGNPQPGPKFDYKLAWMERLAAHAAELYAADVPVVLAGDYNVVPTRPRYLSRRTPTRRTRSCSRRAAPLFQRILDQGWVDAIRTLHPDTPMYTFWDYMRNRWPRDAGLRLDHLLLSDEAAKRLVDAGVDRDVRGKDGASDHAPAWIVLRDGSKPQTEAQIRGRAESATPRKRRREASAAARRSRAPAVARDRRRFFRASLLSRAAEDDPAARARRPAGAILGFANFLLRLYRAEQPRAVLVAWDTLDAPTYRQKLFPAYQSGREFDDALARAAR